MANEVALQHIYRLFYKQLTEVSFEVVKDEEMAEEIVIEIMIACLLFKIEFSGLKDAKDYLFSEVKEYSQTYIKETTELLAELLLLLKCSVLSDYRFTLSEIARHKNKEKEDFFAWFFLMG